MRASTAIAMRASAVLTVSAAILAGSAVSAPVPAASAVTFSNQLGCADSQLQPVVSMQHDPATGLYVPLPDGPLGTNTDRSGYPAVVNSAITAGTNIFYTDLFTTEGSAFATSRAFGTTSVGLGTAYTITEELALAQRVQVMIQNLGSSGRVDITGYSAGGSPVLPIVEVQDPTADPITATPIGTTMILRGGESIEGAPPSGSVGAQVWFDTPISRITYGVQGNDQRPGAPTQAGYVISAPIACLAGSVTASAGAATVTSSTATATSSSIPYTVAITNTATDGMWFQPRMTSDLAAQVAAAGLTLDGITPGPSSGSGASTCAAAADASVVPTGFLGPGSSCIATFTLAVTRQNGPDAITSPAITSTLDNGAPVPTTLASNATVITVPGVPVPASPAPPPPPPAPPAPPAPPVPVPAPAPPPAPTPAPVIPVAPAPPPALVPSEPSEGPEPSGPSALPMNLGFAASSIVPGTVATMRGTIGPNAASETVTITLTGRVGPGMIYRGVEAEVDGGTTGEPCVVETRAFTCTIPLRPDESAGVEIRLLADALNAPDIARQQLAVASSLAGQDNAVTVATDVTLSSDTDIWAASVSTFNVTTFPGAFLLLLALLLFALAATAAEAEQRRRAAGARAAPAPAPAPDPNRSES